MKEINKIFRRETGQTVVVGAFALLAVMGVLAVSFDIGAAWLQRRNLQNVADAAALAGAQSLNGLASGRAPAEADARNYVSLHAGLAASDAVATATDTEVTVVINKAMPRIIAGTFGLGNNSITARAKARTSNRMISEGIVPIAVPTANIGTHGQVITITSGVPRSANGPTVGNIELPPRDPDKLPMCQEKGGNGNGADDLGDGIECGSAVGVTLGQVLTAKVGGSGGPVREAFEQRVLNSTDVDGQGYDCLGLDDVFTNHSSLPWTIDPRCAPGSFETMLVLVPVIGAWTFQGQKGSGAVIDLALFWVDPDQEFKCPNGGVCDIRGMWITNYSALLTPSGGGTPGGPFDIFKIVELIE